MKRGAYRHCYAPLTVSVLQWVVKNRHNKRPRLASWAFVLALPIFPGRLQPSIVGRSELNFRVRDGNGWTLALISTNYSLESLHLQNRTTKEGIRKA